MSRNPSTAGAAIAIAACLACTPQHAPPVEGDLALTTTVQSAITGGTTIPVGAVWVHLWGTSTKGQLLDVWYPLAAVPATPGQYSGTVAKIPAGSYLAHGKAFTTPPATPAAAATAVADFESVGDVGVLVLAKLTATVTMTLQQNTTLHPPDTVNNAAPVVDSLVAATNQIDSSGPSPAPVTLRATASDANGPADITGYQWAASYAPPLAAGVLPGVFSAPTALQTDWTPPVDYEGTVTFSFTVTDRRLASSTVTFAVAVSKRFGFGSVVVTVSVNNWPDVLSLTTTDGQLLPSDPTPTSFTALAVDPDGDDVQYQWSDGTCGGSFGSPNAATTTYLAGPTEGACPITVAVTDFVTGSSPPVARGGRTLSTLIINVRPATVQYAPSFIFAARSGAADLATPPGAVLQFLVDAVQPVAGDPITYLPITTYLWSDGLGGAFTPLGGDPASVRWTAPACALLSPPFRVPVVVEAVGPPVAGSLVTPLTFSVLVACP